MQLALSWLLRCLCGIPWGSLNYRHKQGFLGNESQSWISEPRRQVFSQLWVFSGDHGDNQTFQRGCSNEKQSTWHGACCVGVQINVIAKLMIMTMIVETEGVRRHHIPSSQTHYEICVWHWVLGWLQSHVQKTTGYHCTATTGSHSLCTSGWSWVSKDAILPEAFSSQGVSWAAGWLSVGPLAGLHAEVPFWCVPGTPQDEASSPSSPCSAVLQVLCTPDGSLPPDNSAPTLELRGK